MPLPAVVQQLPNLTLKAGLWYWSSAQEEAAWQAVCLAAETGVVP